MTLNTNIAPYYNDFDETLNYHQILFRPGMAVQARELTQLQNILQTQTKRFSDAVYKDGAVVSGGSQFVETVIYIKIASSSFIDIKTTVGKYAVSSNGSVYKIKDAIAAEASDPITLYCTPVTNISGNQVTITSSETLTIKELYTAGVSLGTCITATTDAVGNAVFFNVDSGIYYTNGFFVRSEPSSICLGKYEAFPTKMVGFDVVETIVDYTNSDLGGDTLLDPAQGSYNYAAPGADRFRIDLKLRVVDIADVSIPVTTSNTFIELNRVVEGKVSRKHYANQYSLIGDTMARRTYDESGDYVVSDFKFRLEKSSLADYVDGIIQPGKAYIKGYEVETLSPQRVPVPKARTTASAVGYDIPVYYGNYFVVSGLVGGSTASMFDVSGMESVSIYSDTTPTAGNKIGTARVKSIEYVSGTGTGAVYKLFVTDAVFTGNSLSAKSVANLEFNTFTIKGNIDASGVTNIVANTSFNSGASTITVAAPSTVFVGMLVSGTGIQAGTVVTTSSASTIGLSLPTNATSSGTVTFSANNLYDSNYDSAIFRIPHSNIASVSSLDYAVRRTIDVSVVTGTGSTTISASGERFKDVSSTLNMRRHYIAIVKSKTAGALTIGTILSLTYGSTPSMSLDVSSTTLTLNTGDATFNGVVQIIATIDITGAPRKTKTLSVTPKSKTLGNGLYVPGTVYSLGYADVNRIIGVYEAPDNLTAVNNTHSNITSRFVLTKNHKDAYYDHSTIELASGATAPTYSILVEFEVLEHSSGHGFFSADSYPVYDNIPSYTDKLGKLYNLTDCIDFRQKRVDDVSSTLSAYTPTVSLVGQQNIDTVYNFGNAEYSYYLSRIDKIVLQKDGRLAVVSGVPDLNSPQEPSDVDTGMTLAIIRVPAYTKNVSDIITTLVKNRRYTMKDVGKLDDRIARLEYYSTLNELEKEIVNTTFTTAANETLFNSGFIVDTFRGHGIGNVLHPDYKCSVDFNNKTLRPSFKANAAQWIMNGGANGLNYVSGKKFAMLPIASEVPLITQNIASGVVSVNPFNVQAFVGSLRLSPDRDIWFNTQTLPDVITNEANDAAAVQAGIQGTTWGEWILMSSSVSGNYTTKNYSRTGEETSIIEKTVVRSSVTDVVETSFSYRMRDQDIEFTLDGVRPNTSLAVWFDGINITLTSCKQYNTVSGLYDIIGLTSDSKGSARGVLQIRDTMFTTFKTGKKLVQISDGWWNPTVATTYCENIFYSEGKTTVNQTSKVMGIDYITNKRDITETKTDSVYSPPPYVPPSYDPAPSSPPATYYGSTVLNNTTVSNVFVAGAQVAYTSNGNGTNSQYVAVLPADHNSLHSGTPSISANAQPISSVMNTAMGDVVGGKTGLPVANSFNSSNANAVAAAVASGELNVGGRPMTAQEAAYVIAAAGASSASLSEVKAAITGAANILAAEGRSYIGTASNGTAIQCSSRGDPTAQTFFIDNDNSDGVFISSIDTFFSHKNASGTVPITLELRPTVNGYPDSYKVIPGSVVIKQASDINLPANQNIPVPTTWTFSNPIYLPRGEYAVVLKSDSAEYFVYISEMGAKKLGTDEVIASQPTLGSYFASQNATTWTADQNKDLMFSIRRASFPTNVEYASVFDLSGTTNTYGDAVNTVIDGYNLNVDHGFYENKNLIRFEISTKDMSSVQSAYVQVIPGNDILPGYRSQHYASGDTKLRVTMSTTDEKLSPYAEIFPSSLVMIENIINNGDVAFPETLPINSGSDAVYITKPYVLEEGFDASSARVLLMENIPTGAAIEVYMKGLAKNDASDIQTLNWVPMVRKTPSRTPATFNDYYDAEYGIDNFSYSTYNTFRAVMFKIVMKATDPSRSPSVKKFRAIALA